MLKMKIANLNLLKIYSQIIIINRHLIFNLKLNKIPISIFKKIKQKKKLKKFNQNKNQTIIYLPFHNQTILTMTMNKLKESFNLNKFKIKINNKMAIPKYLQR